MFSTDLIFNGIINIMLTGHLMILCVYEEISHLEINTSHSVFNLHEMSSHNCHHEQLLL